jgi:hypothetical protein
LCFSAPRFSPKNVSSFFERPNNHIVTPPNATLA